MTNENLQMLYKHYCDIGYTAAKEDIEKNRKPEQYLPQAKKETKSTGKK